MRISDWSSDVCSSDLPRLAGIAAPMHLADAPAGQHHPVARLEGVAIGGFDGSREIDARHMRILPDQLAEAVDDHPVLVVDVGIVDADGDIARRQVRGGKLLDLLRALSLLKMREARG